jgi:hypothetical protein
MEYSEGNKPTTSLLLPMQVAPIDRTVVASALNGDGSVNPSFGWGDIWDAVKTYGPSVAKAILA